MTDYSKMSDGEIAVAIARQFPQRFLFNNEGEPYELIADSASAYTGSDFDEVIFDPCNSWADAGPIAQEKHIGINYCSAGKEWIAGDFYPDASTADFGADKYFAYDTNPCRAICIVFLMMNEGEW